MIAAQHDFTGPFESTIDASKSLSIELNGGFFLLVAIIVLLSALLVYIGNVFGNYQASRNLEKQKQQSLETIHYNILGALNEAIAKPNLSRTDAIREINDEVDHYLGAVLSFHGLHFKTFDSLKKALAEDEMTKGSQKSNLSEIELGADQDRLNHAMWKAVHDFRDEWQKPETLAAIKAAQASLNGLIVYGIESKKQKMPSLVVDPTSASLTNDKDMIGGRGLSHWLNQPAFGKSRSPQVASSNAASTGADALADTPHLPSKKVNCPNTKKAS